jgi:hypothetical protein
MVHEFRWRGADVLRLLAEAQSATGRRMTYTQRLEAAGVADSDVEEWSAADEVPDRGPDVPPALHFVKDHGVYLMSNAVLGENAKRDVVYAAGYDPDKVPFEEWHIGGDDFVELLERETFDGLKPDEIFIIRLDPHGESFEIGIAPPPRRRK